MVTVTKQHLIDPEICIRCYTCEEACSVGAISHNADNVVVDASVCNDCMDCISPCPTGSIDNWRMVNKPYSLDQQLTWLELPEQEDLRSTNNTNGTVSEAIDDRVTALLAEAHQGAGGKTKAPASASKPAVNLFGLAKPAEVTVQGNFRLTAQDADADVRHIILNLGSLSFPVLEGQSIGFSPPGTDENGAPHLLRLYSVSSPRDGERPNTNNLSITVKREQHGICSNYICDLKRGDKVQIIGPFGATFLMPNDPKAKLLMICTGTGSAPFRAFTMQRQRTTPEANHPMVLFFGARTPDSLPYFGPLKKIPETFIETHFAFSRVNNCEKQYVQDRLRAAKKTIAPLLTDCSAHIYICGLKAMEAGVENVFEELANEANLNWQEIRNAMRETGRYHVETY